MKASKPPLVGLQSPGAILKLVDPAHILRAAAAIGRRAMQARQLGRLYSDGVGEYRIVVDHRIMGGVPCVAGTRIPVATVVGLIATGLTPEEIRADFPQLTADDVRACLAYAARAGDERELPVRFSA